MFAVHLCFVMILTALCAGTLAAREQQHHDHHSANNGPAVGQTTTSPAVAMDHSHRFEPTPDGGLIVMQRSSDDLKRVAQIRSHIAEIVKLFTSGDFRLPPGVDPSKEVPGTTVMKERLSKIKFTAQPLPRGSEVVITSADPKAIAGIHEFLEFHRREHQAYEQSTH
jgi:hypothetical protein